MSVIKKTFAVEGMHCGACCMILKNLRGVKAARADFDSKTAEVEYEDAVTGPAAMNEALAGLGYRLREGA